MNQKKTNSGSSNHPPGQRLSSEEKRLFLGIWTSVAAAVGFVSGVAAFTGSYTDNGLQSLLVSFVIVVTFSAGVLLGVLLWKRRRRRVAVPWSVLVLGLLVLLTMAGMLLKNSIADSDDDKPSPQRSPVLYRVQAKTENPKPVPSITVQRGQAVRVTQNDANETWSCAQQETLATGIEGAKHDGDSGKFEVSGKNICLLIGKVGDQGEWKPIGPNFVFVADDTGPLWLKANEIPSDDCLYEDGSPPTPRCYSDNEGSIEVTIRVG